MKKLYILLLTTGLTIMSFAQTGVEFAGAKADTTDRTVLTHNERILQLEKEINTLKASHAELHKQLQEIKTKMPTAKKKKLVINRVGTKQGVWVYE